MATVIKDTQFNFRTNSSLLESAKQIVSKENYDMTTIMNQLLQKIVEKQSVPIELIDEKAKRREMIIDELFTELQKGYDDYKAGRTKPADEVFKKYGL